jgi:hypothetical protein
LFYYFLITYLPINSPFGKKQSSLVYKPSTYLVITYFPTYLPIQKKGEKNPIKTDGWNHHSEDKGKAKERPKDAQPAKKKTK